jgi:hypothetical protein
MRRFARRILAAALSVALAAGGAAFGAHAAPKAHSEHGAHAAHAPSRHAEHAHHHGDHAVASDEQQPAPSSDRADSTCCTMCVTASPLPPAFDGDVMFAITAVRFADRVSYRAGTPVRVDPGIPKTVV